jgi:fructokinase
MFVVSGEALMDVFAAGETTSGMALDARIGGSPLNVAMGLARLGQAVAFFGAVGTGFLGQRLERALREEGIGLECLHRTHAPTTLSLVGLNASGVPSYAFYGEGGADRQLPISALNQIPATARAFHFGSYAMVVEPVAATQRALVMREHLRSLIAYDPNVRLNVEPALQRWRDTLEWMLPRTHLLKISDEDFEALYPGQDMVQKAQVWLNAGVQWVVITRGERGALGFSHNGRQVAAPVKVEVVDTVGAGDTFQAALLCGLAERNALNPLLLRSLPNDALQGLLDFATGAAAITCSRRGADLPRRQELKG